MPTKQDFPLSKATSPIVTSPFWTQNPPSIAIPKSLPTTHQPSVTQPAATNPSFITWLYLSLNNIRVALNIFILGMFLGVGSLILLFENGRLALGSPLISAVNHGQGWPFLKAIGPHTLLEITALWISGGAGLSIGFSLLFARGRLKQATGDAILLLLGTLPLVPFAALLECLALLPGLNPQR